MSIAILTICDWGASSKRDTVLKNPSWAQVEAAIRALNNNNLNDIYLQPHEHDAETYLVIGGGAGRYILSGSIKNESFPTLVDRHRSSAPSVQVVVGGQTGDYPSNWITDLKTALATAKQFVTAGGFESDTNWVAV